MNKETRTDEELLKILKDEYNKSGELKTSKFRANNGLPHYQVYYRRFGDWNNALRLAGLPTKKEKFKNIDKKQLKNLFIQIVNKFNKIPQYKELEKLNNFPAPTIIYKYFEKYDEFVTYCGFNTNKTSSGRIKDEFLLNEIKRFISEFNKIPIQSDFENLDGYPSRKTFSNHFGSFNEAIRLAGYEPVDLSMKEKSEKHNKEYLLKIIRDYYKKYNKTPTMKELTKEIGYEPKHYYVEIFGKYNNAILELGLPLNSVSHYDDEFLHSEFERFVKENGRIPAYSEFNNSEYPSFWCYQNRFGSWNNAVRSYGYDACFDEYTFDNIKNGLIKMCNEIYNTENRKIISVEDINNCEYTPKYSCCLKHIKKNGTTIRKLLRECGFDYCKSSMGMIYEFEDGERTVSKYEFDFSRFLRENGFTFNKKYFRDVKYKTLDNKYNGNMNCDYCIIINNSRVYIEIAGYLRDHKKDFIQDIQIKDKLKEQYRIKLMQKEQMLKDNNLEYYILFPSDLQEDFLLSIFKKEIN